LTTTPSHAELAQAELAVDVRRAQAGDTGAFERLYRAHVARVYSIALRILGREEAEEATQEAFVRVWNKLQSFRAEASFATWLHRLAVNVCLTRARRTRHEEAVPEETLDGLGESSDPDTGLRMDLETAIQRLPEGARRVFVLHDVEGWRHAEIAAELGVDPGTSKSQLHRARMLLRRYLDAKEGRSDA
jgi:RNA polymerase sigma factor (sigma-70 family)